MSSPAEALERDAGEEPTYIPFDPLWNPLTRADLLRAIELLAAGTPLPPLLEQLRRQWTEHVA